MRGCVQPMTLTVDVLMHVSKPWAMRVCTLLLPQQTPTLPSMEAQGS